MCSIKINPEATHTTITRAFEKAAAQRQNYTLRFDNADEYGNIPVTVRNTKTGAFYTVETEDIFLECIFCPCPEYGYSKFCKHCAMAIDEIAVREQEAAEEWKEYARADRDAKY